MIPHTPRRPRLAALALAALAAAGCTDRTTGDHPGRVNTTLQVSPATITLAAGQAVRFTATSRWGGDVLWSVIPASCGGVLDDGTFTARSAADSPCTIVATLRADVRYTGAAHATVLPAAGQQDTSEDLVQASGALQATDDGTADNAAIAGELTPATDASDDGASTSTRHGFSPIGSPDQP
jgi:hypothetical protein